MKVSKDETWRDYKRVKEQGEENLAKMLKTESKATVVSTSDARETSIFLQASECSTDCLDKPKVIYLLESIYSNFIVNSFILYQISIVTNNLKMQPI